MFLGRAINVFVTCTACWPDRLKRALYLPIYDMCMPHWRGAKATLVACCEFKQRQTIWPNDKTPTTGVGNSSKMLAMLLEASAGAVNYIAELADLT